MRVDDLSGCALFLDLDGTLIDIASVPQDVRIPLELVPLLGRLGSGLQGALAIITGRQIVDIDQLLDPLRPVAAGVHGAELRMKVNGAVLVTVGPLDPHVTLAVHALGQLAPGVIIEPKVYSIAVHYRLAPSVEPQIERVLTGSWQAVRTTSSSARAAVSSRWCQSKSPKALRLKHCWLCHVQGQTSGDGGGRRARRNCANCCGAAWGVWTSRGRRAFQGTG